MSENDRYFSPDWERAPKSNIELAQRISVLPLLSALVDDVTEQRLPTQSRSIRTSIKGSAATFAPLAKVVAESELRNLGLQDAIVLQFDSKKEITEKLNPALALSPKDVDKRRAVLGYTWVDPMSIDDRREIIRANLATFQEDSTNARTQLVEQNTDLVRLQVDRYLGGRSVQNRRGDFMGEGNIALVEAATFYDWRMGYEFTTYVGSHIYGALRHYARDKERIISPPREVFDALPRVNRAKEWLIAQGLPHTERNITAVAQVDKGTTAQKILAVASADRESDPILDNGVEETMIFVESAYAPASLNSLVVSPEGYGQGEISLHEIVADPHAIDTSFYADVHRALSKLPEEELLRRIVYLRLFGDMQQNEIALALNVTERMVQVRLAKALTSMKKTLNVETESERQPITERPPATLEKRTLQGQRDKRDEALLYISRVVGPDTYQRIINSQDPSDLVDLKGLLHESLAEVFIDVAIRTVFIESFVYGRSVRQIGSNLGVSGKHISKLRDRALEQGRVAFQEE
jgi:RNA polymerase sigma factor (sigma-70 family)